MLLKRSQPGGRDHVGDTDDTKPVHEIPRSRDTTYWQYASGVGSRYTKAPESLGSRRRKRRTSVTLFAHSPRARRHDRPPPIVALFSARLRPTRRTRQSAASPSATPQRNGTDMITRRLSTIATVALAAALVGVSTASLACPSMSWSSDDVDYVQDICMQRAEGAFGRESWGNIYLSGNRALSVAAEKGLRAGVVLCLDRAIGADHPVAVVFVTGGDGNLAPNERDRLRSYLAD
jgi:hypothetical protein